ncbi:hypothetical protein BGS_0246 [Beggiatoa sp. SS]|nr:hypothetical protein BGS_0246 [Beggiatoa sp. SS]
MDDKYKKWLKTALNSSNRFWEYFDIWVFHIFKFGF